MKRLYMVLFSIGILLGHSLLTAKTPETIAQKTMLPAEVQTAVGTCKIENPLIRELLQHPIMQRLQHIDQHGPSTYFGRRPTFTRHSHSIGVFALLKQANCSLAEQVAGLLHDTSHTTFSHVADRLFCARQHTAYQDSIHDWFLYAMDIESILQKHGLSIADISVNQRNLPALKQGQGALCADRIEYNLHTGIVYGDITPEQSEEIAKDLKYENETWFFQTPQLARAFAELPLKYTQEFWGHPENTVLNLWMSQALQHALSLNLINFNLIHFGTDATILSILDLSTDCLIKSFITRLKNPKKYYRVVKDGEYHLIDYPKFRGIDPLVKQKDGALVRLTEIDKEFEEKYLHGKEKAKKGYKIWLDLPEFSEMPTFGKKEQHPKINSVRGKFVNNKFVIDANCAQTEANSKLIKKLSDK